VKARTAQQPRACRSSARHSPGGVRAAQAHPIGGPTVSSNARTAQAQRWQVGLARKSLGRDVDCKRDPVIFLFRITTADAIYLSHRFCIKDPEVTRLRIDFIPDGSRNIARHRAVRPAAKPDRERLHGVGMPAASATELARGPRGHARPQRPKVRVAACRGVTAHMQTRRAAVARACRRGY